MVKSKDAFVAFIAVIGSWRLHLFTFLAELVTIGKVQVACVVASCVHNSEWLDVEMLYSILATVLSDDKRSSVFVIGYFQVWLSVAVVLHQIVVFSQVDQIGPIAIRLLCS